jgi:uronate dehydrogenase
VRILITGVAGRIGSVLRTDLRGHYAHLRLTDKRALPDLRDDEDFAQADLTDFDAIARVAEGIDVIVHLGATAMEDAWPTVLQNNIAGTFNIFEAARVQNVRRVIFASTHHVVGYYPRGKRVAPDDPVRPDSRYAVSKVFGESLGRLYADKHGIETIAMRIGTFQSKPLDRRQLSAWISRRDMVELTRCCIDAPKVHFEIVFGVSDNRRNWWDIGSARRLGYVSQDDAESYAAEIDTRIPKVEVQAAVQFQGGNNCATEFSADLDKLLASLTRRR